MFLELKIADASWWTLHFYFLCYFRFSIKFCDFFFVTDAAGNFLCPANSLSFNAFKTVMEIDTMGTFNTSKVVYEKWFQVGCAYLNFIGSLLGGKITDSSSHDMIFDSIFV